MSLTWLGNLFTSPSNDETVLEAVFKTYTDMIILMCICNKLSTLILSLPHTSTSSIRLNVFISYEQATRTCWCFFCYFMMSLRFMRTVLMIWLLYRNLWFYIKWFYTCAMHIMYVYVCSARFDFTSTLYTTDFTWTLYTTENKVYIHLRM